jgi:retron-type reverse transcriptase
METDGRIDWSSSTDVFIGGRILRNRPRRVWIPKADGRQRPWAIAALDDKIVQHAVVPVLNQIWEEDFLGFWYGFRPEGSPHNALDALYVGITSKKVNYVLDLDIRSFFDQVGHDHRERFVRHRIGDERLVRLILGGGMA